MRFQGEEDAVIVEGEVLRRSEPQAQPAFRPAGPAGPIYEVPGTEQQYGYGAGNGIDVTGLVDVGVGFASDPRSRTLALLVKVPLFTYVALSHKMPGLVRLSAAFLGVMEAVEFMQRRAEVEAQLPLEWR